MWADWAGFSSCLMRSLHWLRHSDARQVYDLPLNLFISNRSMTVQVGDPKKERDWQSASRRLAAHQNGRAIGLGSQVCTHRLNAFPFGLIWKITSLKRGANDMVLWSSCIRTPRLTHHLQSLRPDSSRALPHTRPVRFHSLAVCWCRNMRAWKNGESFGEPGHDRRRSRCRCCRHRTGQRRSLLLCGFDQAQASADYADFTDKTTTKLRMVEQSAAQNVNVFLLIGNR